jgi:hypothetical protein
VVEEAVDVVVVEEDVVVDVDVDAVVGLPESITYAVDRPMTTRATAAKAEVKSAPPMSRGFFLTIR